MAKVLTRLIPELEEIMQLIKQSIATPYIYYDEEKKLEIGYCILDMDGYVTDKYIVSLSINDITLNQLPLDKHTFNLEMTKEGYFRFWVDDIDSYLIWAKTSKDTISLEPRRRK